MSRKAVQIVLVNENGDIVRLGVQLATPGGEGAIYEVTSEPSLVAKLYHSPPDAHKTAKLQHLCRAGNRELLSISAWPKFLLFASNDRWTVRGFVMPRIQGKEIHRLYGPRDRQVEFPTADWDFLIHVARNCAAAFETLHENGVVMADVNEKNLFVTSDGLVRLIDCDSYQVLNGKAHFLCDVGVPLWTPPELQLRAQQHGYHSLERTPNHDRFGLAVLIFELLFMGRHPFAGVPDGHQDCEIHEAVQRFLFAFSPQVWRQGIKAPPHTLPLAALPERLVRLFERAFLPGSEGPNARPTGREWAHELDALHAARRTCSYDPGHKYWNGLTACPWCRIVAGGGPNFFISVAIHLGTHGPTMDISVFWSAIQRVANGDLMKKGIGPVQSLSVTARPMPMPRPIPPRVSEPQAPSRPPVLPLPPLASPIYPPPPTLAPPAPLPKLPLGYSERDARTSGFVILLSGLACVVLVGLELFLLAIIAGAATCAFTLVWAMKSYLAVDERRQRKKAERYARERERRQAKEQYMRLVAEHDVIVTRMKEQHARAVAEAEAAHARENEKLEAEYQHRFSAYSAQLSLFKDAWTKFEQDKRRWDNECAARAKLVEQSRREMDAVRERLRSTLEGYQTKVRSLMPNLESAYQRFQNTSADEVVETRALEANKRAAQLRQYLDSKLIRNHRIRGIGPVKAATLVAYGYESALDIGPKMNVPGIGPVLLSNLLMWRVQCEAEFRYNATAPLPQADVQAVKLKYAQARQSALIELRGGAGTLSALEAETRKLVNKLEAEIPQLGRTHAQALANYSACS